MCVCTRCVLHSHSATRAACGMGFFFARSVSNGNGELALRRKVGNYLLKRWHTVMHSSYSFLVLVSCKNAHTTINQKIKPFKREVYGAMFTCVYGHLLSAKTSFLQCFHITLPSPCRSTFLTLSLFLSLSLSDSNTHPLIHSHSYKRQLNWKKA